MKEASCISQHIEDLAVFLDPVAFDRRHDISLAKRRDAAWREAANRVGPARPQD
ncbi:hypothetical protein [Microvirga sesbaniae]|uniref:hypothetical protein n=1 Tax=Microvirga sesbaniae TaxID=681392 RepID=UPI0021C60D1C|nr:hypothetical protein [Microvirga sp. HBU67692]